MTSPSSSKSRPGVLQGIVPYVNVVGASDAAAFYKRAFGAEELFRMPSEDDKRLMHCHLKINGGSFMMSDCFPEHGYGFQPSHSFSVHLQVDDADAWWKRAIEAGDVTITMPLQDQFWGDRYGALRDPFGVNWSIGSEPKAR
jgi:uncharacterized glyoxalase superfamily protein PhnB